MISISFAHSHAETIVGTLTVLASGIETYIDHVHWCYQLHLLPLFDTY